jgi:hypothetical protein
MKCKKTIYLFNLSLEKKQAIKTSDKVNKKMLLNQKITQKFLIILKTTVVPVVLKSKHWARIAAEPIELNRIVSVLLHFLFIYIYLI